MDKTRLGEENIILCESSYDFKYRNIFSRMKSISPVEGTYFSLLKYMLKSNACYHIRYVKYRGYALTLLRIFIVYLFSLVFRSKIIWSCHNIYEHNIPSRRYNDFLRILLCLISKKIIVFHEDLVGYLPRFCRNKIVVSSFGDFSGFFSDKAEKNVNFNDKYSVWKEQLGIVSPDIVSISSGKKNNFDFLIKGSNGSLINVLVVAPNYQQSLLLKSNIFVYSDFVYADVARILRSKHPIVGFVGHNNISVPTSIYMFASFGIPVIGLNVVPVSTIISDYNIGIVVDNYNELNGAYIKITGNYQFYKDNCKKFISENSWENAAAAHSHAFI